MEVNSASMEAPVTSNAAGPVTTEFAYLVTDIRMQQVMHSLNWLIEHQTTEDRDALVEALDSVIRAQQIVGRVMSVADW